MKRSPALVRAQERYEAKRERLVLRVPRAFKTRLRRYLEAHPKPDGRPQTLVDFFVELAENRMDRQP